MSPGASGDTAGAGGLSALGDRAVTDGLSDWWAPALVARAADRHAAIAVSTLEAATWVADQTGTTTLYRLHDDVNIDWGRDDYIANHNLFVCDRIGTELAAVAAPVTFRWLTTGGPNSASSHQRRDPQLDRRQADCS